MNWTIEIKPAAETQYRRLDNPTRKRIRKVLEELEADPNPLLHRRVRSLTGRLKGDYRLRVGNWRVLFTPDKQSRILFVYAILPRGDAY
jgi:mRNA interferase RelE/StbE